MVKIEIDEEVLRVVAMRRAEELANKAGGVVARSILRDLLEEKLRAIGYFNDLEDMARAERKVAIEKYLDREVRKIIEGEMELVRRVIEGIVREEVGKVLGEIMVPIVRKAIMGDGVVVQ